MESLDSTLETKRPAAALSLLSQQQTPQALAPGKGEDPFQCLFPALSAGCMYLLQVLGWVVQSWVKLTQG